jgi:hypothetical protein
VDSVLLNTTHIHGYEDSIHIPVAIIVPSHKHPSHPRISKIGNTRCKLAKGQFIEIQVLIQLDRVPSSCYLYA